MTVLFVSPHADDVCLSLAGVASAVSGPKHLLTVFSRSTWTEPGWAGPTSQEDVSRTRAREDAEFCERLGLTYHALGLADSSVRHVGRGNLRRPSGDEARLRTVIEDALAGLLRRHAVGLLVGPLGLGGHADHVACARAVRRAGARHGVPLAFYEDLPYAEELGGRALALRALRMHPSLRPVLLRVPLSAAGKLALADTYASQRNERIWADVARRSAHLARGLPTAGEVYDRVCERLWTRRPEELTRYLDGPVDVRVEPVLTLLGSPAPRPAPVADPGAAPR